MIDPREIDALITKARHAIETDQPNLAMLYMRKAERLTTSHRAAMLKAAKRRKRAAMGTFDGLAHDISEAFEPMREAFTKLGNAYVEAFGAIAKASQAYQSDFALAAEK